MSDHTLPLCVTCVAVFVIVALAALVTIDFFYTQYPTATAQGGSDDGGGSDPPPPPPPDGGGDGGDGGGSDAPSPPPTGSEPPPPTEEPPPPSGGGSTPPPSIIEEPSPSPLRIIAPSPSPKTILERSLMVAPPAVSEPVTQVANTAANPAITTTVATVATVSTAATVATAATASSSSAGVLGLIQSIFPFLAIRRRNEPWGRVTEERTNAPIKGAVVTIIDKANRPRATVRTRADGTFGVLLPKGEYQIVVTKPGYLVPPTPQHIALFPGERVYTQGYINTEDEKILKGLVIPLRSKEGHVKSSWADWRRGLSARWRIFQARWGTPILVTGAMLNTVSLLQNVTRLAIILSIVYVLLLLIELALSRTLEHAIGRVYDIISKQPVSLALVRLIDSANRQIVTTEVSSSRGQFLLRPRSGSYQLQVAHNKYQPYTDNNFHIRRQFVRGGSVKISLQPRPAASPAPLQPKAATTS